jgi:anti-sigma factor RsiW
MAKQHTADELLEVYSMNRLSASASAPVEEHLFDCTLCQDRLANWDEYTRAMRAACRSLEAPPRARTAGGCSSE